MSIIQNLNPNRPVVQVDGRIINQNASTSQESLRSLETGERLSGKIISLSDENGVKNAQIRLGDNMVISAKLQDGMYLKEGQVLSFEVRGVSNQITLTPLYENTSIDPTTLKALNAAGIEVNQDTVAMVKSMMENGMGIDKNSLGSMYQIINSNPGAGPESLVQMKALDIPINEQNIQQFESYKNYEHQVTQTLNSIMDDLPTAYDQLVQDGKSQAANDLYGGILDMLSKGAAQMEEAASKIEAQTMNEQSPVNNPLAADGTVSEGGMEKTISLDVVSAEEALTDSLAATNENNGNKPSLEGTKLLDEKNADKALNGAETDKQAPVLNDQENSTASTKGEALRAVFSNDFANIIKELNTTTGFSGPQMQKLIAQAASGEISSIDQNELLKELTSAYAEKEHAMEGADKAFTRLFGSNEYNKLMKSIMEEQWLLKPDDVSAKENIQNLYERLNSQAKQLTAQLTQYLGSESKVAQSAANLQNNIDFMNQLSQMFHYVQLPLKMAEQDAHGDLYVYSNGKKKFEPGDTVSAILHLDMDNLGPLDVYVKMKDNNVKTNFYVADETVIDLIAEHIDELTKRLHKRGYNMECRMMLHTDQDLDSEDPPVSAILDAKKTSFLSVTSFDARA